jgi:hypothetical protein
MNIYRLLKKKRKTNYIYIITKELHHVFYFVFYKQRLQRQSLSVPFFSPSLPFPLTLVDLFRRFLLHLSRLHV